MNWGCLLVQPTFKPGDPRPTEGGYLTWHEWADVQHKAGLKQVECPDCSRWCYPQELSDVVRESEARSFSRKHGEVVHKMRDRVCLACVAKRSTP